MDGHVHDLPQEPAEDRVEPVRSLTWDGNRTLQARRLGVDLVLALRRSEVDAETSYSRTKYTYTVRLGWPGAAALTHALDVAARVWSEAPDPGAVVWCGQARKVGVVRRAADGAVHLEALADGKPFRSRPWRLSHPTLQQIEAAREKRAHCPGRPASRS
ncbi:hypothetical protein [Streptomyces sp. SM12]|uniref:hypothetical protein n=1 Tax=Streptomyces sp. SM12 TaxID=1071602 RepID=UPI000CD56138|nr:hypothetical protein [Streptomyces sp. SM12]